MGSLLTPSNDQSRDFTLKMTCHERGRVWQSELNTVTKFVITHCPRDKVFGWDLVRMQIRVTKIPLFTKVSPKMWTENRG
jgi:hypothetical protein